MERDSLVCPNLNLFSSQVNDSFKYKTENITLIDEDVRSNPQELTSPVPHFKKKKDIYCTKHWGQFYHGFMRTAAAVWLYVASG